MPMNLHELIARGEGEELEFKQKTTHPHRISRTLVSLANTRGGQVLVGVDGKTVVHLEFACYVTGRRQTVTRSQGARLDATQETSPDDVRDPAAHVIHAASAAIPSRELHHSRGKTRRRSPS